MIKAKVISLAIAGIVGVGGTVAIAKRVDWNQRLILINSKNSIAEYVNKSNEVIEKSENIIETQNQEIQNLKNENKKLMVKANGLKTQLDDENGMISSLNKVIATLQGSSDYKHMTVAQKKKTLNNLLKDWGYGKISIRIADKIFSWTDGWGLNQIPNNKQLNMK